MTSTYFVRQAYLQNREVLSRQALSAALRMRQRLNIGLWDAVCPHDIAERLGIEVSFIKISSLEGMYCQGGSTPLIVLSSERPVGRQNFTCAHEIGHHEHGDGTRIDEFLDDARSGAGQTQKKFDPIEFRADRFASFLLMPKSAVDRAFAIRGMNPQDCGPECIYAVAGWLGVGYSALIEHLCFSLHAISQSRASELRRMPLPRLRASIAGVPVKNVKVVDEHWGSQPVDVQVGDSIVVPRECQVDGACLENMGNTEGDAWRPGVLLRAIRQGKDGLLSFGMGETIRVRVSHPEYSGRAIYRHLFDPDEAVSDLRFQEPAGLTALVGRAL